MIERVVDGTVAAAFQFPAWRVEHRIWPLFGSQLVGCRAGETCPGAARVGNRPRKVAHLTHPSKLGASVSCPAAGCCGKHKPVGSMKGEKSVASDSGTDPDVEEEEQEHADGQHSPADGSCCGQTRICNKQVLRSESIAGVTSAADGPLVGDKAPFRLVWGSATEKSKQHKHDVVSFGSGNITAAVRSSKQITLVWDSPPRSIFVLCKPDSSTVLSMFKEMSRWLKEDKDITLYVEPRLKKQLLAENSVYSFLQSWEEDEDVQQLYRKVDLVVTLGGDGTMLWAATMFKGPIPPVVAFSMGSLGFMTPFSSDQYKEYLQTIMTGPVYITLRHRLHCQIVRNGEGTKGSPRKPATEDHLVLNEVVVDRGMSSFLTNLEVYCDNLFVTHVQGDGLILSTPSGSTAYSLAAGGSMVHPEVPGILFTPICPHSLSFRPLILPEYVTLRVQVPPSSRGQPWASFDGKDRRQLTPGDALIVSMSVWPVPAVCDQQCTNDFFRSVREGLHWNLRKSQSADGPEDQASPDD